MFRSITSQSVCVLLLQPAPHHVVCALFGLGLAQDSMGLLVYFFLQILNPALLVE